MDDVVTTTIGQQQYRTAEVRRILGLSVTAETDVDCTDRLVGTTPLHSSTSWNPLYYSTVIGGR